MRITSLDGLIIVLMFALLPVDMINGILLMNNIKLPISFGQFYKFLLLLCLLTRFLFTFRNLVNAAIIAFCLIMPSFYHLIVASEASSFFSDLIKISKYLMPIVSFFFFVDIIKRNENILYLKIISLVRFSYIILILNILVKYIGLGYPAYKNGGMGTKGFFFAGNEISALLVILSSILAFLIWKKGFKTKYYLFLLLNLLAGLTISSKTAVLGIILVFFSIPFRGKSLNIKKFLPLAASTIALLPIVFLASWKFIKNSSIMVRLEFFYAKLDFWTFVLSSRNVFLEKALETYIEEYNILEKIIGVGQSKYEYLNNFKVVEMDLFDIFFSYGILGWSIFITMIIFILIQSKRFAQNNMHPFASFVFTMTIVLLIISTLAGHVFGSGMSAVFLGILFSLMYRRRIVQISKS